MGCSENDNIFTFGEPGFVFISRNGLIRTMGSDFKFIHCADLHLGGRFKGVSDGDPELGRRMRSSIPESFSRIVDLVKGESADALVISGDIYDDEYATPSTRFAFAKELERAGVPVFICRGNHDSATSWDSSIPYPPNVHEFPTEPESFTVHSGGGDFEVVGVSFGTSHEGRNLASMMTGRRDMFTIACVHCDVDSASEGYRYAPCRLSDLTGRGVDYWALGHIHKRQVLSEDPYVVYPGNIQGRSFKETGEKGAYVVTVSSGKVSEVRFVPTQGIVWHDMTVDITGKVLGDVVSEISSQVSAGDLVRIGFIGHGDLDGMLRDEPDDVMRSIRVGARCRVASMRVDTTPETDIWSLTDGDDLRSKVVSAGRDMMSLGREEIIGTICSHPIASRYREHFESLSDDELREMVEEATVKVVHHMGVSG